MKIDNFALTMHQTCPAKYQLRMHEGWTAKRRSGALGFGGALHAGIAEWYRTGKIEAAVVAISEGWPEGISVDDFRTKEKCVTTMLEYVKKYPSEPFQIIGAPENPLIEVPFTLELGLSLSHCQECDYNNALEEEGWQLRDCKNCGRQLEPLEYGGILDGGINFSGQMFVFEHKSTTQLGSQYFNQFKPNNQISGYIWAGGLLSGMPVAGAMVNAIGIYKASPTKFERSITARSPQGIESWKRNVQSVCNEIKSHERTGYWPQRTGSCTQYGLCEYHSVHTLENPLEQIKRLETDYVRQHWDYELREG